MSNISAPLRVVVVSLDSKLLHEISWMLTAVGYAVECTKAVELDALWRRYGEFDFIIYDGRELPAPNEPLFGCELDKPVYGIFVYDAASEPDFSAWYGIGANDGLRVPISRGELLMRIRTGARYLEFERRLNGWAMRDDALGCYTQRGFLRKLSSLATTRGPAGSQDTLILTSINWFEGIRRKGGQTAADRLVASAARVVNRHMDESAITAYLGGGCFAILLLGEPCQMQCEPPR
jgi:hypothetical protein